jgi:hypothetical protein
MTNIEEDEATRERRQDAAIAFIIDHEKRLNSKLDSISTKSIHRNELILRQTEKFDNEFKETKRKLEELEMRIRNVEHFRQQLIGASAAISAILLIIGVLIGFIKYF